MTTTATSTTMTMTAPETEPPSSAICAELWFAVTSVTVGDGGGGDGGGGSGIAAGVGGDGGGGRGVDEEGGGDGGGGSGIAAGGGGDGGGGSARTMSEAWRGWISKLPNAKRTTPTMLSAVLLVKVDPSVAARWASELKMPSSS